MFFSIRMLVRWWVSDQSKDGLFRHRYLIKYLWFTHIEIAKRFTPTLKSSCSAFFKLL